MELALQSLLMYGLVALIGSTNFAIGFYMGRFTRSVQRDQSRAISPRHPAPAIQRRIERVEKQQAIHTVKTDKDKIRVISPRSKAKNSLDLDTH